MEHAWVKRAWTSIVGFICISLACGLAWADFYVIAGGNRAKRTVLVSPKSTQRASGDALLQSLDKITDASEDNPYLVFIEPGIYDIGAGHLDMKPFVDIKGSGENVTRITGTIDMNGSDFSGVVNGSDDAELSFLTVENTGGTGSFKCVGVYDKNFDSYSCP